MTTTTTTLIARYRPGRRRAKRSLLYRGQRRRPSLRIAIRTADPVWPLGAAAGALWVTALVLADTMGVLPW